MNIEITQTINEYPQWVMDYSSAPPIRIPESVPVNFEVGRFRATSTVPDASLNYFIARGDTPEQNGEPISFYSRLDERTKEMMLLTYRPLDYETLSRYTLTIKAAVSINQPFSVLSASVGNQHPSAASAFRLGDRKGIKHAKVVSQQFPKLGVVNENELVEQQKSVN